MNTLLPVFICFWIFIGLVAYAAIKSDKNRHKKHSEHTHAH